MNNINQPYTHSIQKPSDFGCVLYNLQFCMQNVHPISDKELFQTMSTQAAKQHQENFFYYRIANGISGYIMYYFCYKLNTTDSLLENDSDDESIFEP
jgi:hypothetical protein